MDPKIDVVSPEEFQRMLAAGEIDEDGRPLPPERYSKPKNPNKARQKAQRKARKRNRG